MQRVRDSLVSLPISIGNSTTIIVLAVDNLGNAMQPATRNGVLIDIPTVEGDNFKGQRGYCSLTLFSFLCPVLISPLPVKPGGGTLGFLAVRHSVCLSVCPSTRCPFHSVFRTFLSRPLRCWLEIWYVNLSSHNTDQVGVSSRLTYIYRSYCPLLKFSFPGFSLPSFEILTWNLVYEFVLTQYRSSSSFVTLDQLL